MSIKIIQSEENKTFKDLFKLKKGNAKEGLFLAEGRDLLDEARKSDLVEAVLIPEGGQNPYPEKDTIVLKQGLFRQLANYQSLPERITLCKKCYAPLSSVGKRIVYLDKVQDPGNLGTILRSALSFSYTGVVLSFDCVSLYNNKAIQSSKGALFKIPVAQAELSEIDKLGYHIYLTTLDGEDEKDFASLDDPFCLVFGNEGQGVSKKNLSYGKKLKINRSNIDSLNVAVAAGIFRYRFRKGDTNGN